jgi:hypothetical protein
MTAERHSCRLVVINELKMLRIHLKRPIADKDTIESRGLSLNEICEATGIHVSTLSRLATIGPLTQQLQT